MSRKSACIGITSRNSLGKKLGITKSNPKVRPDKNQASRPIAASQDSINGARILGTNHMS